MDDRSALKQLGEPGAGLAETSDSGREMMLDAVRRHANAIAVLAAVASLPLLVTGVGGWRLGAALLCPIVLAIAASAGRRNSATGALPRTFFHPVQTGVIGALVLIGTGLHSTAGVGLAALALLVLARPPTPPVPVLVVGVAALGPWLAEAVAGVPGPGTMVVGVLVVAMVALVWARSRDVDALVLALCIAAIVYVGAAILLFLLGVTADYNEGYLTQARTNFGPFTFRWRLPLSVSWVTVPTVSTLGAVLCVWSLRLDRLQIGVRAGLVKMLCAAGLVLHLVAVLGANGRTHLLATVAGAVVASGVIPRLLRSAVALASAALWLAPIWWDRIAGERESIVATILREYVPSRGGTDRTATLQGRTHVWQICFDFFNAGTFPERFYGWGPDGHIESGAAAQYSSLLGGGYRVGYYPPHNATLEVLLTGGIALTAVLLAGVAWVVFMQAVVFRHGPPVTAAGIAGLAIAFAAVAFPEVSVLLSNASPAAVVGPMVVMITLAAYGQTAAMRRARLLGSKGAPHTQE